MSFFKELKRRNVFRVGLAYAMISWLVLQITDVVVPIFALQPWAGKLVFLMLAAGLPVALILAWAFELTPEGIRRDSEVDHEQTATARTGRKLDFVIISLMAIALIYFALITTGVKIKVAGILALHPVSPSRYCLLSIAVH